MILVSLADGACESCGGQLEVVGVSDATMEVECQGYGEANTVEPDAFDDGGINYWPRAMLEFENDFSE